MSQEIISNKDKYRKLWETPVQFPVFNDPRWLDIICTTYDFHWDVAIIEENTNIIGFLPYCFNEKQEFVMPPYTQTLGIFIDSKRSRKGNAYRKERDILENLISQLPSTIKRLIPFHTFNDIPFLYRDTLVGINKDIRISYVIDYQKEKFTQNYSSSLSKKINTYQKRGLSTHESSDYTLLEDLSNQSYAISSTSLDASTIQYLNKTHEANIWEKLAQQGLGKLFAIKNKDEKITDLLFVLYNEYASFTLLHGKALENRDPNSGPILYHFAIETMQKYTNFFDFEGSVMPSVESFFIHFGAERKMYLDITWESIKKQQEISTATQEPSSDIQNTSTQIRDITPTATQLSSQQIIKSIGKNTCPPFIWKGLSYIKNKALKR